MKKVMSYFSLVVLLVLTFGMIVFPFNNTSHAISEGEKATVIVSKCYLYTSDNFSSDRVSYQEEENTILVTLNHGDEVEVISFSGDFVLAKTSDQKEGYIYKYYLTDNTSQAVYPVFNASIRKNTVIYDIDKNATEYIAKKDSRIYIYEGFNDKEKYTAVQVVLEDKSLYNGYILTEDIKPDGVSGLLIVAISIILAGVLIIVSLLYIKKKRKK